MYDARTLKPQLLISETEVECPVRGCPVRVPRQRRVFRAIPRFQCPNHGIYISPSTFEYPAELDNLLWADEEDLALLASIRGDKRESRMARENSEDALSWNVFRYLEKRRQLAAVLSSLLGRDLGLLQLVYWSYAADAGSVWPPLTAARREFGEHLQRSSEPDLIAYGDRSVLFIEAKFTAGNRTTPSNPANRKRYLTGGDGWYGQVFRSGFEDVAVAAKKYELMRLWLLGSWIAAESGRDFYLVNLVRAGREREIERAFGRHIDTGPGRYFVRLTWEAIHNEVAQANPPPAERDRLIDYLAFKTAGYNRSGELQRAFSLPLPA